MDVNRQHHQDISLAFDKQGHLDHAAWNQVYEEGDDYSLDHLAAVP